MKDFVIGANTKLNGVRYPGRELNGQMEIFVTFTRDQIVKHSHEELRDGSVIKDEIVALAHNPGDERDLF